MRQEDAETTMKLKNIYVNSGYDNVLLFGLLSDLYCDKEEILHYFVVITSCVNIEKILKGMCHNE